MYEIIVCVMLIAAVSALRGFVGVGLELAAPVAASVWMAAGRGVYQGLHIAGEFFLAFAMLNALVRIWAGQAGYEYFLDRLRNFHLPANHSQALEPLAKPQQQMQTQPQQQPQPQPLQQPLPQLQRLPPQTSPLQQAPGFDGGLPDRSAAAAHCQKLDEEAKLAWDEFLRETEIAQSPGAPETALFLMEQSQIAYNRASKAADDYRANMQQLKDSLADQSQVGQRRRRDDQDDEGPPSKRYDLRSHYP